MTILFIMIMFMSFISLGLPDSGMGVAWPFMRAVMNKPLEAAGLFSIIVTLCGIASSLLNEKLTTKLGSGLITALSCTFTGSALLGIAFTDSFIILLCLAVPLGFGGGSVDASLNNFVAKHFSSRIMNWLHACWGIGASISPIIITYGIKYHTYQRGYLIIALIQLSFAVILFSTLFLWKRDYNNNSKKTRIISSVGYNMTLRNFAPWASILSYFLYVGLEASLGLWLNSMLLEIRHFSVTLAGLAVSIYFGCIMAGRVIAGFANSKFDNRKTIRIGMIVALIGAGLFFVNSKYIIIVAITLIGLGIAPIYPCLMHETARRFNIETATKVIGYQMAAASFGSLTISPLIGLIGSRLSLYVLIIGTSFFLIILFFLIEVLNRLTPLKKFEKTL